MYSDDENNEETEKKIEVDRPTESSVKVAKTEKLMDSSDEDEADESLPNYCEELFRFKEETKKKIEEFKDARSKYIFEENFHPSTSNRVHEGDNDSEIYNGRCILLRKMRFKTGRLRSHYKSLRPFKNYTLNRQISSSEVPPEEKDDRDFAENNIPVFQSDKTKIKDSQQKVFTSILRTLSSSTSEIDIPKKVEPTQASKKRKCKKRKKKLAQKLAEKKEKVNQEMEENVENEEERKSTFSETKSLNLKKDQIIRKKEERRLSSRVLDNLNIDRPGHNYLEPCLCDNGKEVTVVIKGFCLCKKMKQGKHRFQRICEQYAKPYFGKPCSGVLPPQGERRSGEKKRVSIADESGQVLPLVQTSGEKVETRRRDSTIEDQKPRAPEQDQKDQEKAESSPAKDENIKLEESSKVSKQENETETNPKEPEEVTPVNDEKEKSERVPPVEDEEEKKEERQLKENKKETREQAPSKEDEKEEREPREDEDEGKKKALTNGDRREKKENMEEARDKKRGLAPAKELKDKEEMKEKKKTKDEDVGKAVLFKSKETLLGDKRHSGSLRTIFENKSSKRSKMALTKEQLEKMSKITKTR